MTLSADFEDYMRSHVVPFGALIIELGQFCPVECAHCHVESDKSTRGKLLPDQLASSIARFSELPFARYIYLTGGEPFSHLQLLKLALECAATHSLKTYVLTSAFWARDTKNARNLIAKLPSIDLLGISYDQYHAPKIPFSRLQAAAKAALDKGTRVFFALGSFGPHDLFRRSFVEQANKHDVGQIPVVHYPLLSRGKGAGLPELDGLELHRPSAGGCRSIGTPVLTATGGITACCHTSVGNSVRQGNVEILQLASNGDISHAAKRFATDPFLRALRTLGPTETARLAGIPISRANDDICASCDELRHPKNHGAIESFCSTSYYPSERIEAIETVHEGGVMKDFRRLVHL